MDTAPTVVVTGAASGIGSGRWTAQRETRIPSLTGTLSDHGIDTGDVE